MAGTAAHAAEESGDEVSGAPASEQPPEVSLPESPAADGDNWWSDQDEDPRTPPA